MSHLLLASLVTFASDGSSGNGSTFVPPGTEDFWQPLYNIGDGSLSFTRPALLAILAAGVLIAYFVVISGRLKIVPSRGQMLAEAIYGFVRNTVGKDIIGTAHFMKFVPLLFTLFTFILLNNVFEIIPFVQYPTFSRIGFDIALVLIVYVTYHVVGIRAKGGFFAWTKAMIPPGVPAFALGLLIPLELLKYFVIQPLTLALRLFGNMFAGHLLLVMFALAGGYLLFEGSPLLAGAGILSFATNILLTFFELLVEFLQAFIFTMLAALYISDALSEGH